MAYATNAPLIHRLPVLGRVAREIEREPDAIWYLIVGFLSLVVMGTKTFGLVFLTMTALTLVPVIFVLLVLITRG